jgi:hypothetical protein
VFGSGILSRSNLSARVALFLINAALATYRILVSVPEIMGEAKGMAMPAAEGARNLECAIMYVLLAVLAVAQGNAILAVGAKVSALPVELGAGHFNSFGA